MDNRNFNGLSYRDRRLGEEINLVLNEYDSIARKISASKNDIFSNQNKNNTFNQYKYNQKLMQKSPYISRKKNDIYNPYSFNYNNDSISTRNNETFFGRNNLIEDFKDTLEKSQIIKDDLLRPYRKSTTNKKYNSKKYSYLNEIPTRSHIKHKKDKLRFGTPRLNRNELDFLEDSIDNEDSNCSNGGINENIPNGKEINKDLYIKNLERKNDNLVNTNFLNGMDNDNYDFDYNENNKKKLELTRDAIIKAYQKIKKENRILEVEINNYKNLANQYLNFGTNYDIKSNNYYESSINNYKQSFQQNVQNNCRIIDLIINNQQKTDYLINKIKELNQKNKIVFQRIEQKNRKNAEIQILNEENEQKMINLEEEKNTLTEELEKNKILLVNLKNKEHNLNLLNESNKRVLHDNEEHINKLRNMINQYKSINLENSNYNTIETNNNIKLYDQKINNLKNEINNLLLHKQKALFYKDNLQSKIFGANQNNYSNNNETDLMLLKNENIEKKKVWKKKRNKLKYLRML
jgi:hypothetical protein